MILIFLLYIITIKSSRDVFIFGSKTKNLHQSAPEEYKELLLNKGKNLSQKSVKCLENVVNMKTKDISKILELGNKIECFAKTAAFTFHSFFHSFY